MKYLLAIVIATMFSAAAAAQGTPDQILGRWTDDDRSRVLEFVRNGSTYDAIIREADTDSLVGKVQISDLSYAGDNRYEDGTLYIFRHDRTASCTIRLLSDSRMEFRVRSGLTSRTQVWTKL